MMDIPPAYWKRRIKYISHLGWLCLSLFTHFPTILVSLVNYGVEEYFFALMISLLGVADFSCGYFTLLTFWDTANAKYLYSYLRYPVLTPISLFLSSLRPFAFFGGFSPRMVLVLDLGLVLGHSFFLCIYSGHRLSGCRKKFHAVMQSMTP